MRLAQAILFTRDVARLQRFYTHALDLDVVSAEPGWVQLDAGGFVLALHAIPAHVPGTTSGDAREGAAVKLCFHADDLDGARAALVAAGARMRDIHRYGDVAYCDGVDPDGNVFQITTR